MKIANILGGHPDPIALGKRSEPADAPQGRTIQPLPPSGSANDGSTAALRQILEKYNVADITPSQFSEMVQKLYDAGAISQQEFNELSAIRVDLEADGVDPDEAVNLVERYRDKAELGQRLADAPDAAEARAQLGPTLRRLDWLEKLSAMHAQADSVGISALV